MRQSISKTAVGSSPPQRGRLIPNVCVCFVVVVSPRLPFEFCMLAEAIRTGIKVVGCSCRHHHVHSIMSLPPCHIHHVLRIMPNLHVVPIWPYPSCHIHHVIPIMSNHHVSPSSPSTTSFPSCHIHHVPTIVSFPPCPVIMSLHHVCVPCHVHQVQPSCLWGVPKHVFPSCRSHHVVLPSRRLRYPDAEIILCLP